MIQKVKNPGDILFSILNTTYEFLGEKGGEEMIKEWCEYVAENGLWSGVVDATKKGGIKGLKKFWDDFIKAEQVPEGAVETSLINEKEFLMVINKCHSQETLKKIGAKVYKNACLHCVYICKKMAEMIDYDLEFKYDPEKGWCSRRWIKKK